MQVERSRHSISVLMCPMSLDRSVVPFYDYRMDCPIWQLSLAPLDQCLCCRHA